MSVKRQWSSKVGIPFLCVALLMTAACARGPSEIQTIGQAGINPDLHAMAIREVRVLQSKGQRVWCVPCLLYTSPSPRDVEESRMPSSA